MDQDKDQLNGNLSPSAAGFGTGNILDAEGKNLDLLCSPGYRIPSAAEWKSFSTSNIFVKNTGFGDYGIGAIMAMAGKQHYSFLLQATGIMIMKCQDNKEVKYLKLLTGE